MAEPYRFGGPIPESVARLKSRREYRASSLYVRIKRYRGEKFDEERERKRPEPRSPEHAAAAEAMRIFEGRPFTDARPGR